MQMTRTLGMTLADLMLAGLRPYLIGTAIGLGVGLEPTELEVTQQVALGRTNPQIAEQLLMGRETVKSHVFNALRKLGLTNRTELAAAAAPRRP